MTAELPQAINRMIHLPAKIIAHGDSRHSLNLHEFFIYTIKFMNFLFITWTSSFNPYLVESEGNSDE